MTKAREEQISPYVYAIDICAYAVMSNHYHAVLHVDKARAGQWSDREKYKRTSINLTSIPTMCRL